MDEREEQINYRIKIQGEIINKAIIIEKLIDKILLNYFKPKNELLFISHILNSSVMHYGGKLKVLYGIINTHENIEIENSKLESLRRISSIRNSFAHTNIEDEYDIHFNDIEDDPFWIIKDSIEIMNSAGKIDSKDPQIITGEFNKLFNKSFSYLKNLMSIIE